MYHRTLGVYNEYMYVCMYVPFLHNEEEEDRRIKYKLFGRWRCWSVILLHCPCGDATCGSGGREVKQTWRSKRKFFAQRQRKFDS